MSLEVQALGELAVILRKRRGGGRGSSADKRSVLNWLRSLSGAELASLRCVEDVGFVKTLLHMAACSRASVGGGTCVQEFQLLPHTLSDTGSVQNKRVAAKTPPRSAARAFVKRPVVRTKDGDIMGSFHTQEYEEGSKKVLRGMRLIEVISKGGFLMECPEDVTLKHETKWLKEQGHYSLQALFMNEILELNIWAFWKQYKKDVSVKIPMQGIASKFYIVREWEAAR
ncbi:hypothetical protein GN244_ATG05342 [Phytophthora infestans]|uniref:Uncharacterized protein n=1 Tax=Phytophthora infestans TaxID=4787 RepID=A0A833TKR5_PHYIN|nr:hypothetical protein GN244_ATG05342 [Phytophthora infestans]